MGTKQRAQLATEVLFVTITDTSLSLFSVLAIRGRAVSAIGIEVDGCGDFRCGQQVMALDSAALHCDDRTVND
jgi:hypothetical protein